MPFFQNPFTQEFRGSLVLSDRQYAVDFVCPRHTGRTDEYVTSGNYGPYNLSGGGVLAINYAVDVQNFKAWATILMDLTALATDSSAVTAAEAVAALQAHSVFPNIFSASVNSFGANAANGGVPSTQVVIKQKMPYTRFHFYVSNTGSEAKLRFNKFAGVAQLPTYFARHTIANVQNYCDSVGLLIQLDPTTIATDQGVIDNAVNYQGKSLGFSYTNIETDWQLLAGRSGIFQFTIQKDTNNKLVFPAGSVAGGLAMQIQTQGEHTFQLPYTLTADDLAIATPS